MPAIVLVGAQWGDEGKGKATDLMGSDVHYVVKFNGGNNAGFLELLLKTRFGIVQKGYLPGGLLKALDVGKMNMRINDLHSFPLRNQTGYFSNPLTSLSCSIPR